MFKYSLSDCTSLRDRVLEHICPSVEYLKGFNGSDLSEQQDIDTFIEEFISITQKLSDKDVQKVLNNVKVDLGMNKSTLAIYVQSINSGISLWKTVIPPIFQVIHSLKPEDFINRSDGFKKSGDMINSAENALFKWVAIPGLGKYPMPKWSSALEKVIRAEIQSELRRNDDADDMKPLLSLGYTSKTDLLLIPAAMKEFFASSGKYMQFKKEVDSVVNLGKIETLYKEICKLDHSYDDTDDLEYGIQHYGALSLLSEKLDRLTYHSVQKYMSGPYYLVRDASQIATVIKKQGQSIFGRIFGK